MKTKVIESAVRIFYLIKILFNNTITVDDMIYQIYEKFNYSLEYDSLHEYLMTIKSLGFPLKKKYQSIYAYYHLEKSPVLVDFDSMDYSVISKIEKDIVNNAPLSFMHKWEFLKSELQRYSIKDFINTELHSVFDKNILKYENYCLDKQRLEIDGEIFEPIQIDIQNKESILWSIDVKSGDTKKILLNSIQHCEQLPLKSRLKPRYKKVEFKIKGELVNKYAPYKNETITERGEGYLIVTAKVLDEIELMYRLFKYNELCEILSPKSLIEKQLQVINEMLSKYQEVD